MIAPKMKRWQPVVLYLVAVFLCSGYVLGQIATSARLQPWPLYVQSSGMCCTENNVNSANSEAQTGSEGTQSMSLLNSPLELLKCINASESMTSSKTYHEANVAIITYVRAEQDPDKHFGVPDIMTFAAYHAAVTAAYAEHNGYDYRFITPDMPIGHPDLLEPADVRWNKIKLLIDALNPQTGWAKHMKYIAWIDADAIILDMGMDLEEIMEIQYPNADMLASADIRQGYINSGFLLIRNTIWMRQFLQRWWDISDRRIYCDQDAFDSVYTEYIALEEKQEKKQHEKKSNSRHKQSSISSKVVILRRDALNTDPPATLRQQPHNQVLHLMGESSAYRAVVFREAFQAICQARTGGVLPAQMGLNRKHLEKIAIDFYRKECQHLLNDAQLAAKAILPTFLSSGSDSNSEEGVNKDGKISEAEEERREKTLFRSDRDLFGDISHIIDAPRMFESLGRASHHLCDLLVGREDGLHEAYQIRVQIFMLSFKWLEKGHEAMRLINARLADNQQISEALKNSKTAAGAIYQRQKADKDELAVTLLQLLKRAAEAGNDVFGAAMSVEQKRDAAEKTFRILKELHARVARVSQVVPAHMQALMHQNMAHLEYELGVNISVDVHIDTDTITEEEEEEKEDEVHSKTSRSSSSSSSKRKQKRDFEARKSSQQQRFIHLQSARSHAEQSVQLFDEYFPPSSASSSPPMQDRSITSEHIQSLQILAAVHCTEAVNFTRGMLVWERAVYLSSMNMRGVLMGPPLDMYGGILHNAAVCHLEASNSVTGDSAEDTTATTFKNKKEALERALLLSTEAVAARTMFSKQQGIPYDELQNHVINKESNNLLFLSKELMRSIEQRLVIEVGVDGKRHEPQQQQHTYTEADFDDEEWEECVEGEEGCEAFVISDASPPPAHALASVQVSSSKNKALNNMDIDIEDVIDMDVGLSGLQDGGLSRSSQGLENTLDGLDSFMQNLQATETNTGKPSGTVASTILKREVQEEEQEEEQEWEECEAGESGCESFYVTEDTNDNGPTLTRVTENNEEDIDDEDERELAATREMWAKQTASFAGR